MRAFTSILLLTAYLVLSLKPSLPLLEYEVRQNLIASEFCVNSDDLSSSCAGSCYLNKRLKEAAGEQDPTSESQEEIVVPVHSFQMAEMQVLAPDQAGWEGHHLLYRERMTNGPNSPPPELFS